MNTTPTPYTKTDRIISKATSWAAVIILLVLAVLGFRILRDHLLYQQTNDAQVQEYINPVVTRVAGYITQVRFEENQAVKKGDTLFVIDAGQYQFQQSESVAATENAQSALRVLETNITTAERLAAADRSQIDAAQARLTRQSKDFERYTALYRSESATAQQLEKVKEALDIARSELQTTQDNYSAALARIDDYRSQRPGLLAEIKRRNAVEQRTALDLGYTVITAPYQGKIGRRTIQQGEFVQANQTLAHIVDQDAGKWVVANFKETQIGEMKIGQPVLIETDAYPGRIFDGRVESLSPGTGSSFSLLPPDNSTGNFVKIVQRIPVRIRFSGSRTNIAALTAGMNATVKVIRP